MYDSTYYHDRIWRTLTSAEWDYLFKRRIERKTQPSWALAKVDDKYEGILIFPDDFELLEAKKVGFSYSDNINYGNNTYTTMSLENFQALEKMGVVFLPKYAHYWSATSNGPQYAKSLNGPHQTNVLVDDPRYTRNQVRLVKDIIDKEFTFNPADAQLKVDYPEDSRTFRFKANVDWKAESTVPWLSVSTHYGSKGEQTLTIHFPSNYEEERIGAIVVTGRNKQFLITVRQIEFDIFRVMDDPLFAENCRDLDLNRNGRLSIPEGRKVDKLDFYLYVVSAKGIEYFTNLREVMCAYTTKLTSLDLTNNKKLQKINCRGNEALTSLDLSGTEVKNIVCYGNPNLTTLDLSECAKLETADCYTNALTTLKVNGCTALKTLICYENQLRSLKVTGYTSLETLDCYDNKLSSLEVIGCTALKELNCYYNEIDILDVSGCTSLEALETNLGEEHVMTSLNASGCTSLKDIGFIKTIVNVNLSGCTALTKIWQDGAIIGSLKNLNLSGCTGLTEVSISFFSLASLDASDCTSLTKFVSTGNNYNTKEEMSYLNLSGCTALTSIKLFGNNLLSLQIDQCTALKTLDCYGEWITELDVSTCTALETLKCSDVLHLISLDVSQIKI